MWAEVLDAGRWAAFVEAGDPFDPALAHALSSFVYAAGATRDPMEALFPRSAAAIHARRADASRGAAAQATNRPAAELRARIPAAGGRLHG